MDWQYLAGIAATAIGGIGIGAASVYFYIRRNLNSVKSEEAAASLKTRKEEDATAVSSWKELMEYNALDARNKIAEYEIMLSKMRNDMQLIHNAHMKCERDGMEREIEFKKAVAEREIEFKRTTFNMQEKLRVLETQVQTISNKQDASNTKAAEIAVATAVQVVDAKVDAQAIERLKVHSERNKEQIKANMEELEKLKGE